MHLPAPQDFRTSELVQKISEGSTSLHDARDQVYHGKPSDKTLETGLNSGREAQSEPAKFVQKSSEGIEPKGAGKRFLMVDHRRARPSNPKLRDSPRRLENPLQR